MPSLSTPPDGENPQLSDAERAQEINRKLAQLYPDAECALDFTNPLELTVATLLSAQCTDERVNRVTPELFQRYPDAQAYASAVPSELEEILRPLGFQRAKAKHLIGMGEKLLADYGGKVPQGIADLTSLPGVGRKTAIVVRGNVFGIPGLSVDTHFARLVGRLGLSQAVTPRAIERDVSTLLPEAEHTDFSHRIIFHGRQVCHARTPECENCGIAQLCPSRRETA